MGGADADSDRRFTEAARLGMLLSPAPIDHPDQYFNSIVTGAGTYYAYDQIPIAGKVSMSDFSVLSVALEAERLYGLPWGKLVWRWVMSARQSSMMSPNGAISGCLINVPGYRYLAPFTTTDCDNSTWGLGAFMLASE
jgi:hypothetical protein